MKKMKQILFSVMLAMAFIINADAYVWNAGNPTITPTAATTFLIGNNGTNTLTSYQIMTNGINNGIYNNPNFINNIYCGGVEICDTNGNLYGANLLTVAGNGEYNLGTNWMNLRYLVVTNIAFSTLTNANFSLDNNGNFWYSQGRQMGTYDTLYPIAGGGVAGDSVMFYAGRASLTDSGQSIFTPSITSMTVTNGIRSYATNQTLVVVTTGITNTLNINYRIIGFTGTSVTQTNTYFISTLENRGTITVPTDIILQPGEILKGTSCAAQGGQAF